MVVTEATVPRRLRALVGTFPWLSFGCLGLVALLCIIVLFLRHDRCPRVTTEHAAPATAAAARAVVESELADLSQATTSEARLRRWRALRTRVANWQTGVLQNPSHFSHDRAIGLLKLHTYLDLLPESIPTALEATAIRNTVLFNANIWNDPITAADVSPEARLALRALAILSNNKRLAELP